jgi:hypothetical protein
MRTNGGFHFLTRNNIQVTAHHPCPTNAELAFIICNEDLVHFRPGSKNGNRRAGS